MACKTASGKYRLMLLLDEADYRDVEKTAEAAGVALGDVIRMRIRGLNPARRAA